MNCDQVFDILTQGPFPTGEPVDARVERHIACCHECRQMAEALRPAVDLFHESILELDQTLLPKYRGQAGTSAVRRLPEVVDACIESPDLQLSVPVSSSRRARATFWRQSSYVGAATLAVVGLIFLGIAALPNSEPASNRATVGGQAFQEKPLDQATGIALARLSEACFEDDGLKVSAVTPVHSSEAVSKNVRCCTLCHNAANPQCPRIDSIAMLEMSCSGCHSH